MPGFRPTLLFAFVFFGCSEPETISAQHDDVHTPIYTESHHRSILIVVMDTVRADHTSAYGYPRQTTPALSELAATGVRFSEASTAGTWTWPNHASLFTGEPPWVHGATFAPYDQSDILADDRSISLRAMRTDIPTLAEHFGAAGFETMAISANPILRQSLGLTRGFDTVEIPAAAGDGRAPDDRVVALLTQHLEQASDAPQFVFINLFSAHMPYIVSPSDWIDNETRTMLRSDSIPDWLEPFHHPPPYAGMSGYGWLEENRVRINDAYSTGAIALPAEGLQLLTDLYDGNIRLTDHYLGQILNQWVAHHPNGVIIVTSDHGEFLGEHQLLDHGRFVFEEVLHIPMVIRAPDLPAGIVINDPVQLHELNPLILRLSGIETDEIGPITSAIQGTLEHRTISARAWADPTKALHVGGRFSQGSISHQDGDMLVRFDSAMTDLDLFNLSVDPEQNHNLTSAHPDIAQRLRQAGTAATEEVDALLELGEPPLSNEDRTQLEALGYLE